MTYKDCFHSDVCGFECDDALTFCKDFKDKSRIIELPCKIGYVDCECSACGYTDCFDCESGAYNYCPDCGCKMDEVQE